MSLEIPPDNHFRPLAILEPRHPASDSSSGRQFYFRSRFRNLRDLHVPEKEKKRILACISRPVATALSLGMAA